MLIYLLLVIIFIEIKFYKINNYILLFSLFIFNLLIKFKIKKKYNLFFLVYILLLKGNIESLYYTILLNNTNLKNQHPLPNYLIKEINYLIKNKVNKNFKFFIDFGSGNCYTLNKIKFKHKKIGIEYDKNIYNNAKKIIKKNNYNIYKNINCNILNYKFDNNSIIYMYEPLWNVKNNDINIQLFKKLNSLKLKFDIIYITGIESKKLNKKFFTKYNFTVYEYYKIGSIFCNREIYFCRNY